MALPSEEAAPQQAEAPETAEQGLGGSNEPDRAAPAEAPETQSSPAVVASAIEGAPERGKRRKSSEGAATASGGRAGRVRQSAAEPLTVQQHAVVAALMVVMKRAMLEGHGRLTARARLLCNNMYTMAVLQYIRDQEELPSIKSVEQMLQERRPGSPRPSCRAVRLLRASSPCKCSPEVCSAGPWQSAGQLTQGGEPQRLPGTQQVAELHRVLVEHSLPPTWSKGNFQPVGAAGSA